jgi:hypothetical protein
LLRSTSTPPAATSPTAACSLILGIALATALQVSAITPRANEVGAVIQTINRNKRTLTVTCPQNHCPRELVWNSQTQFPRNWKFTTAAELRQRMRVMMYYQTPIFGKPFLTKLIWFDH